MSRLVLGTRIARALAGSWRADSAAETPAEGLSADPQLTPEALASITPHLLRTGAGGLAWWNARAARPAQPGDPEPPALRELHDAFRIQTLHARLHEQRLPQALELLQGVDIQPVLAKGWALAREYPRVGLRPYGDHDLHVAPDDFERARSTLERHATGPGTNPDAAPENLLVDLHSGVPRLPHAWDDIWARTTMVPLPAQDQDQESDRGRHQPQTVRILGPADHLELLCEHFFSHGAWRPLWLCDIALFVETHGAELGWVRMDLSEAESRAVHGPFVRPAVLLAHELLGARLTGTPWAGAEARNSDPLPRWLPRATLRAWGVGGHYSLTTSITLEEPTPRALMRSARIRWPNPIEASVRWRRPFDNTPRLPFQLLDVLVRSWRGLR